MNPTIDNDLQKAIDDITNSTNSDPVFGDAVAAPEPTPAAPANPVTPPKPMMSNMPHLPKAPSPIPPMPSRAPINMPLPPKPAEMPKPVDAPKPVAVETPISVEEPKPIVPEIKDEPKAPELSEMPKPLDPIPTPAPIAEPISEPAPAPIPEPLPEMPEMVTEESTEEVSTVPADMKDVKEAALRDLAPILGKVEMDSTKKFKLYKDIREELHDNSVIAPAYETAKDIADDKERADALLYLIDSIDNL